MTFKEKLTEKAESLKIDVSDHIEAIKKQIEQVVEKRSFTVSLIEVKTKSTVAFGSTGDCCYYTFIPNNIDPSIYMTKFTDAFKELGFRSSEGTLILGVRGYHGFDSYDITVRW